MLKDLRAGSGTKPMHVHGISDILMHLQKVVVEAKLYKGDPDYTKNVPRSIPKISQNIILKRRKNDLHT